MNCPRPYTRVITGKGALYISDALVPLQKSFGNAEFSFCEAQSILYGGCLSARKMFMRMTDAGLIVSQKKGKNDKTLRYRLHPEVFRIIDQRVTNKTAPSV